MTKKEVEVIDLMKALEESLAKAREDTKARAVARRCKWELAHPSEEYPY